MDYSILMKHRNIQSEPSILQALSNNFVKDLPINEVGTYANNANRSRLIVVGVVHTVHLMVRYAGVEPNSFTIVNLFSYR